MNWLLVVTHLLTFIIGGSLGALVIAMIVAGHNA